MSSPILFRQAGLPVFQNKVYSSRGEALAVATGDVELIQCKTTGRVYNQKFDASLLRYDGAYQNEQACSPGFQSHLDAVLNILTRIFSPDKTGVEIGCGKGYFFERLLNSGLNLTGYDPAYEGNNPRILKREFGRDPGVAPDYVILRHVLEHLSAPWAFLEFLASYAHPRSKIYIEAPSFDWIVKNQAFYGIFFEYVSYFTAEILGSAFSPLESGHFFGGQYFYIVAELASFRKPAGYAGIRYETLNFEKHLQTLLDKRRSQDGKVFVWGAGAKGITFANILVRLGIPVEAIVDISPAKQGKFAGGCGTPIVPPPPGGAPLVGADVFVMNPVYMNEIQQLIGPGDIHWIAVA